MFSKENFLKLLLLIIALAIFVKFFYKYSNSINQNEIQAQAQISPTSTISKFTAYKNEQSQIFKLEKIAEQIPCSFIDTKVTMELCSYQEKITMSVGIFDESFMPKDSLHIARLYINTVKYSVLNLFYVHFKGVIDGSAWPPKGPCQAITMTGVRRLDHLQMILEDVILRQIDGDFIELGVWKGGLCILAKAIFHAYRQYQRKIFLADSFEGIPPVNVEKYPVDQAHVGADKFEILSSNYTGGVNAVKRNFNIYFNVENRREKIIDDTFKQFATVGDINDAEKEFQVKVEYLVGFFKDSLPLAIKENKFRCFSVLRLDGDLYESTWQSLENLYPYLNVGGIVIVDDYTIYVGAFRAVLDFRKKNDIKTPIVQVFHKEGEYLSGIYFRKPEGAYVVSC